MAGKVHYCKPSITPLEVAYATEAATNGWGEQCYAFIDRFERGFSEHLGSRHAVATSSGTGALHLGFAGLGIGPGDEVILGDINWVASAAPIVHLGATPVFVDVSPETWCLDPDKVEAAITPRTKAILAVHLYGNLCDLDRLSAIAASHGIALVEDAAEAIGSRWRGRRAGSLGTFGAFSFHGTKTLTTGEGGMFVTSDDALYEHVLTLSNHGRARGETRQFWPTEVGFKYKMANVQAAIGCAQLERIEELVAGKRRVFEAYREALAGLPLELNPEPAGTVNGFWMPTVVAHEGQPFDVDVLLQAMRADGIDARRFFWPLSSLPPFGSRTPPPVASSLSRRAINLPSYHDLQTEDIDRVARWVRQAFEAGK